jgi:DNA-binding response OmpR family regulator
LTACAASAIVKEKNVTQGGTIMGGRVLLIEDEPNIIEAIRFILSRDGWAVDTHSDGATAVEAIRRRRPDGVILDAMLPNRSGYDILADLRAAADTAALPVLMLTARGQARDRELAERHGVSRFMTKPFSNSEVLSTVRELVPR